MPLAFAAASAPAVDIGTTQAQPPQVTSAATSSTAASPRGANQTNVVTVADDVLAQMWGLSVQEIQRAKILMQGPRGAFSSPQLSPIEALGIHARTDAERAHYAKLFARVSYEDTLRVLAWARVAQAEAQHITAGQPVLNFADAPKANASGEAADILGVPRSAVVSPPLPVRTLPAKPLAATALGRAADNRAAAGKKQPGVQ
jgi:hypothetical protein